MAFGIIIIGDEILSGKRNDKHLAKIIELLSERGLALSWAEYLGDDPERITATLQRTLNSGDIVFCCGGIGATPDDHTRQCAAAALNLPLSLHPEAKVKIQERIVEMASEAGKSIDLDAPDNQHRLKMGEFPVGSEISWRSPFPRQTSEVEFESVKVFSLPSVGDGNRRRHIELGVKGEPQAVEAAYSRMLSGLDALRQEYVAVAT